MKFTIYDLRFTREGVRNQGSLERSSFARSGPMLSSGGLDSKFRTQSRKSKIVNRKSEGFTMMEIAISLAVIGIALVAIIGVLPIGMNVQQTNREETVIGQDASVLMEAIRNGTLGNDDMTNYIYAVTNFWVQFGPGGQVLNSGPDGYTYSYAPPTSLNPILGKPLTNAANIVGLLSTPEFVGASVGRPITGSAPGQAIPNLMYGGISNHIVAYCYSMSGPAVNKPPQDNPILQQDSFGYHVYCVNAPTPVDTNLFYPLWTGGQYGSPTVPVTVFYNWTYWSLPAGVSTTLTPGNPPWKMTPNYTLEQALNLHEIRLTYEWPALAKGKVGSGRETFRTQVAGQLQYQPSLSPLGNPPSTVWYNPSLYCYQAQSFTNTP